MKESWELAIQGESLQFLLSARSRERDLIFKFLQKLTAEPYLEPDFTESAPSQREYRVKITGLHSITYWLDHFTKEIRVVRISRSKSR